MLRMKGRMGSSSLEGRAGLVMQAPREMEEEVVMGWSGTYREKLKCQRYEFAGCPRFYVADRC